MQTFHVTITTRSGLEFVREIDAHSTGEALETAHDEFWPEYCQLYAMPMPVFH